MATKTHNVGSEYKIESDNLTHAIKTSDYVGTALKIVEALEDSGETLAHIIVGTDIGDVRKVTLFARHGASGEPKAVPREVHKQLTDWGFEHAGGNDYSYTDAVRSHVYLKD
jgi:hypothetical protein